MLRLRVNSLTLSLSKMIPLENVYPVGLLTVFGALSLRSPLWTMISFILLIISLHVIYKRIRKKCSSFYFSFTLCSLFGAHLVYELIGSQFMRITYVEYVTNIFLLTLTLYLMYRTKIAIGQESSNFFSSTSSNGIDPCDDNDPMAVERRKLAMAQQQIPFYNYCKRCQTTIPGRDHHCDWLNVCIGKSNRYWFLGCITIGAIWIGMIANIFLNSICYPVSIFSTNFFSWGADAGDSPITGMHHYGLVPVTCPEAYVKTSVTIGFVTSMYGLVVLLFLLAVLCHQLVLLYKGVSYLELKYSKQKKQQQQARLVKTTDVSSSSSSKILLHDNETN